MPERNVLDARGLVCPLPIIKLAKAIKELQPGDLLEVRADDPAFSSDVAAWCEKMGHELSEITSQGKDLVALIAKK